MAQPVTIVDAGGLPVTNTSSLLAGTPMTPVDAGGMPVTLVDAGGYPVALINEDGTLWAGGASLTGYALVAPFDALDNVYALLGAERLLTSYAAASPIVRLRRSTDNVEADYAATVSYGDRRILDKAAITTWLGGGTAFVTTVYDQSGNSRNAVQATTANQPVLDLTGDVPVIKHTTASSQFMTISANAFANNVGAASLLFLRRWTSVSATTAVGLTVATNTTTTRMGLSFTTSGSVATGRRTDAEGSGTNVGAGATADTAWHFNAAMFDYTNSDAFQRVDAFSESNTAYITAGSTSATDSSGIYIGRGPNGASPFYASMEWQAIALVRDIVSQAEVDSLVEATMAPLFVNRTKLVAGAGTYQHSASRLPHQRSNFYAAGRWWQFWGDQSGGGTGPFNLKYRSSTDLGVTWSSDTTLTTFPVADAQWNLSYDRNTGKLHVCKNTQTDLGVLFHDGMEYRRGTPASDGTITWDAAWQTVIATGNNVGDHCMVIDSTGQPWIGYCDNSSGSPTLGNAKCVKNSATDGTWTTASGFPATVKAGVADDAFVILTPLASGAMHGTVYEWATDAAAKGYTISSAGSVTSEGDITSQSVEADAGSAAKVGRIESASRDTSGIVHIVYTRSGGADIRYRKRSAAGSYGTEIILASGKSDAIISSPRLSFHGSQDIIVTWTTSATTEATIWMCRSFNDGTSFSVPVAIGRFAIETSYEHMMAAEHTDTSGNLMMTVLDDGYRLNIGVLPAPNA